MFRNYFKIALRNLFKQKGYSLINIVGLAIGIACCFLIVLYVLDELSYDRHYANADHIYRVAVKGMVGNQEINQAVTSALMAETLVQEYPEVLRATRLHYTPNMLIRCEDKVFNESRFLWVDSNFFDVFSIKVLYGDQKTALKDHHTVVMTLKTAQKYFDNPADAIGKIVNYEDGTPYRVSAIIQNAPENSHFHYGMLSPLSSWDWSERREFWLNHYMYTYIVIRENSDPKQLEAKFPEFIRKYVAPHIQMGLGMSIDEFKASGGALEYYLQPLTDIHLHSNIDAELEPNSDIKYIYIFSLIALFILLIACVNFMNLATARSFSRAKEVGMRKVLGSDRLQLIRQFLLESILLTFFAVLIAIVLAVFLLPYFNDIAGKQLAIHFSDLWFILPILMGVAIVVGILAGSYPAFFLASFKPVRVLKGSGTRGSRKSHLRSALVVFQFTISIALFISTFIVYSQLKYVQEKRLGFNKENVLVIKRGWAIGQKPDGALIETSPNQTIIDAFKHDLLQNPQIISVAGCSSLPGKEYNDGGVVVPEGAPREEQHPMNWCFADYDYAVALGLELIEGRYFSREMASDSTAVVINEAAGRMLGYEKPYLGKRVGFPWNDHFFMEIIGVVKDFHYESLHKPIDPLLIGLQNLYRTYVAVRIHPHEIPQTIAFIEKTWLAYIPYKPFEYFFLDDDYDALYKAEQRTGELFGIFSVLAIVIACLGLLGLASFTTAQRTKEIGIRKALGASVGNIVVKLSQEFTRWVLVANIIAWPLAWFFMNQWLHDFAYRINIGLLPFILAGLTALVIALLTISYQAVKAALSNPIDALRYE